MAPTSTDPNGQLYILDWDDPNNQNIPQTPPDGWDREYDPNLKHSDDNEPQLRVASRDNGEPVRDGSDWSARFHLEKDDPFINDGARVELAMNPEAESGSAERWYGFSTYLPDTWTVDSSAESVTQWHQDPAVGSSPPLAILTHNGQWEISQNFDVRNPDGTVTIRYDDKPIGNYETGTWTDWVVHVIWSDADDGLVEIWKNGQQVVPDGSPPETTAWSIGQNTYMGHPRNYMKFGIYKWAWYKHEYSDTQRRVMYYGMLRIADDQGDYDSVAPSP